MNKNIYDTDCVTWSPQGRIFQIEYAAEAVKLGTCVIGIRTETHALLVALRRTVSKLADFNAKVLKVDDHCGVTFSGITADANLIVRAMRSDCMNHQYVFESPAPIERLVLKISEKSQKHTQKMGMRPYGVGLLVAGYDQNGPHIFETVPSGDYFEYHAQAFGTRCQAAKTFLESHLEEVKKANPDELLVFGLKALAATVSADSDLPVESLHVALVGKDQPFRVFETEELAAVMTQHNIKPTESNSAMA